MQKPRSRISHAWAPLIGFGNPHLLAMLCTMFLCIVDQERIKVVWNEGGVYSDFISNSGDRNTCTQATLAHKASESS